MPVRHLSAWVFAALAGGLAVLAGVAFVLKLSGLSVGVGGIVWVGVGWAVLDRWLGRRLEDRKNLPARPEFYDFGGFDHPMHAGELAGRALKSLNFVVFDTETTGLNPSAGDELVSIAGVRVSDGRVDTADSFSRLINPGVAIRKSSIRFHGITDQMVAGEASAAEVLADFHGYVGDAILVAHNAAFDMKFLSLKEAAAGVKFDQLVLDTLLLSVFLDHDSHNHTLDAIANRLGVTVEGRHTALGDALVTAAIWLRLLDLLRARGIVTTRQAIEASNGVAHIRKLQQQF